MEIESFYSITASLSIDYRKISDRNYYSPYVGLAPTGDTNSTMGLLIHCKSESTLLSTGIFRDILLPLCHAALILST